MELEKEFGFVVDLNATLKVLGRIDIKVELAYEDKYRGCGRDKSWGTGKISFICEGRGIQVQKSNGGEI